MAAEKRSYEFLIGYFGEDEISQRINDLYGRMEDYLRQRDLDKAAYVSQDMLAHAVTDYFTDVYRLKEFHGIDLVNKNKIVAYEVYWLLKRKPIQLVQEVECNQEIWYLNEGFATTLIAQECLSHNEDEPLGEEVQKLKEFLDHVLYHLKYRYVDAQNLELMLHGFSAGMSIGAAIAQNSIASSGIASV